VELLALAVIGAVVWFVIQARRKRDTVSVDTWSGEAPITTATGVPSGSPRQVAFALGRVETRRVATSASFAIGIALSGLVVFFFTVSDVIDNGANIASVVMHLGVVAFPLAGMTLLATNRATLRARREGAEELLASTPATMTSRVGGHLVSVVAGGVGAIVLTIAVLAVTVPNRVGPLGTGWPAEALTAIALVAGAGCVGVLLGRWLPHGIVAPLALAAILLATIALNGLQPVTNRARLLAPWASPPPDLPTDLVFRPAWSHLLYVLGCVLVVIAAALLRSSLGRAVITTLTVGVLIAGFGVWGQQRPPDAADIKRVIALIDHPEDHQTCIARDQVRACAYPSYRNYIEDWIGPAARVRAAIPASARTDRYVISQRLHPRGRAGLEPQVNAALQSLPPDADDPVQHPAYGEPDWAAFVWPAQSAVGLPMAQDRTGRPCYSGNQARAVIALWLAAQAMSSDDGIELLEPAAKIGAEGETFHSDREPWAITRWPATFSFDVDAPVVFARPDIAAARQLLASPRARVLAALHAGWERFTDPTTETSELTRALDLTPVDAETARRTPRGLEACE
jgi:hypothetical protein